MYLTKKASYLTPINGPWLYPLITYLRMVQYKVEMLVRFDIGIWKSISKNESSVRSKLWVSRR